MKINDKEYEIGDLSMREIIYYLEQLDKKEGLEKIKFMNKYVSKLLDGKIKEDELLDLPSKTVKKLYSALNDVVFLKDTDNEEKK